MCVGFASSDTDEVVLRSPLRWTAAAAAAGLSAAVVILPVFAHPALDAVTRLADPVGASVTDRGVTSPAVAGERISPGEILTTADVPGAGVRLDSGGRWVLLGPDSTLVVLGRSAYSLPRGSLVADQFAGPALDVVSQGVTAVAASARLRVDAAFVVRVGCYTGSVKLTSSAGRQLPLSALEEALVSGDSLPQAPSPLVLLDDSLDTAIAPLLVSENKVLDQLGAELDSAPVRAHRGPAAAARAYPTRLLGPAGATAEQRWLPLAIGESGRGGSRAQRVARARNLRAEGASWAVVARLLSAPLSRVVVAVSGVLDYVAPVPPLTSPVRPVRGAARAGPAPATTTRRAAGGSGSGRPPSRNRGARPAAPRRHPGSPPPNPVATLLQEVLHLLPRGLPGGAVVRALAAPLVPPTAAPRTVTSSAAAPRVRSESTGGPPAGHRAHPGSTRPLAAAPRGPLETGRPRPHGGLLALLAGAGGLGPRGRGPDRRPGPLGLLTGVLAGL